MVGIRRPVVGAAAAAVTATALLAPAALAADPPGTITLASGMTTTAMTLSPLAASSLGVVFSSPGFDQTAVSADSSGAWTTVPGHGPRPPKVCASMVVEITLDHKVYWHDLTNGAHGQRPVTTGRDGVGATPDGWLERNAATSELFRVTASSGLSTSLGISGPDYGLIACDTTHFAFATGSDTGRPTVVIGDTSGTVSSVVSEAAPANSSLRFGVVAVRDTTVLYQRFFTDNATGATSSELWRHTLGGEAELVATTPTRVFGAMTSTETWWVPRLILATETGNVFHKPVGGAAAPVPGDIHGPAVLSATSSGIRLGLQVAPGPGLLAVSASGLTKLAAPPPAPIAADLTTQSAGRASWSDNRDPSGSAWGRRITGAGTLTAAPESALGTSIRVGALATSGRRSAWSDAAADHLTIATTGATPTIVGIGVPLAMSGHHVLTRNLADSGMRVTDLVTGRVGDLLGLSGTMWGESVFVDFGDRITTHNLRTGADSVALTRDQLSASASAAGLDPAVTGISTIAAQGDLLAWWMVQDQTGTRTAVGWRNLRTGANGTSPLFLSYAGTVSVYGRYVLYTSDGEIASGGPQPASVTVLDTATGASVFSASTTTWTEQMFHPSIGQFGIGWINAAGEPKLTPLPDQHTVPRHEGNPFASASLDTGSGSTWDGEWVFTEALTSCSVTVTNAVGTSVRTLPCNATYAAIGEAVVSWDGTDTTGATVPSGIYTWTVNGADADGAAVNTDGTSGITGMISVHGPASSTGFQALTPGRVLETRPGLTTVDGQYAGVGAVGPGGTITVPVTGRAGVPSSGVAAVVVNITGITPTADTYVSAYPAGTTAPGTSTLNLSPGQVYANGSVVKVGTPGAITLYNAQGNTHLAVDVLGYYPTDGTYVGLTPARLTDTRPGGTTTDGGAAGTGPVTGGSSRAIPIAGRAGIPTTGVAAVVVNLTGISPYNTTYLTAYPTGVARPFASTVNLPPGGVAPNLAVVKLGTDGTISVFNAVGQTEIVLDVLGYIPTTTSYTPIAPLRVLDTRVTGPAVGPASTRVLTLAGTNGIPADATAVAITLTGVGPSNFTYLAAYPTATAPNTSTLNLAPGDVRANTTYVKLGTGGAITLYNSVGTTPAIVDVLGYVR